MNAYTQRIGFDVLTAPLAEVDRRGLSQAWYSALHLAREEPSVAARPRASSERIPAASAKTPHPTARGEAQVASAARGAGDVAAAAPRIAVAERRAIPTPLAQKIERALARPRRSERISAFVLDAGRRVHVAVRASGTQVHVVAVCAPQSSARVARALEEARYALARRGVALEARLRETVR